MVTPRRITRQHCRQRLAADATREHPDISFEPSRTGCIASTPQMTIGAYHLDAEIGRGAFGVVYKATHQNTGPECYYAIKILHPGFTPKDQHRFCQEARILQELRHPALPQFIEHGITAAEDGFDRAPYLVMEFIAGMTLGEQPRVSRDIAMRWCYELADALRYLHNHDIVHRDLKPANIMITTGTVSGRTLRILDLGIALFGRPNSSECVGSLPYMSPELFNGGKVSKAADIYALGLIVAELLSGQHPFPVPASADTGQWRDIHLQASPQLPESLEGAPQLLEMMRQALAKEPALRPGAEEFCEVLAQELYGTGVPGYIGIFGIPASGKTCYLLSLCHHQEVSQETRELIESPYIYLYEKGILPEATALSSGYRFNFFITSTEKYYNIVVRDYAGELLLQSPLDSLAVQNREGFQEKREEIYQFMQRARGILVLVEIGSPHESNLRYRNEIHLLLQKLALINAGRRCIEVPVALVLSKWDRMGDISGDPHQEKQRALDYIEEHEWLRTLCRHLRTCCRYFEIFPVFAFVGDCPQPGQMQPFNVYAPLTWLGDMADQSLLAQCQRFQQQHPEQFAAIIEKYWRLLQMENLYDRDIRNQAQLAVTQVSRDYLAAIEQQIAAANGDVRLPVQLYRRFIQTKGVDEEQRDCARRALLELERQSRRRWLRQLTLGLLLAIFSGYLCWEYWSYRQLNGDIGLLSNGEITPERCHQRLRQYRASWSPLRSWWLGVWLGDDLDAAMARALADEKEKCRRLINVRLPHPPEAIKALGDSSPELIAKEIEIVQMQIRRYQQVWQVWQDWQKRWPELSDLWPERIAELQRQRLLWLRYLARMQYIYEYSVRIQQLRQLYSELPDPTQLMISPEINQAQCQLPNIVARAQKIIGRIQSLAHDYRCYLRRYPQAAFAAEAQQIIVELAQRRQQYQQRLDRLIAMKDLWQKLPNIAAYVVPESSHIATIEQITATRNQIERIRQAIASDRSQWTALRQKYREQDCPLLLLAVESHIFRFDRLLDNWKEYEQKVLMQREQVAVKELQKIGHALAATKQLPAEITANADLDCLAESNRQQLAWIAATGKVLAQLAQYLPASEYRIRIDAYNRRIGERRRQAQQRQQQLRYQLAAREHYQKLLAQYNFSGEDRPNSSLEPDSDDSAEMLAFKKNKLTALLAGYQQARQALDQFDRRFPEYRRRAILLKQREFYRSRCSLLLGQLKKISYLSRLLDYRDVERQAEDQAIGADSLEALTRRGQRLTAIANSLISDKIKRDEFLAKDYQALKRLRQELTAKLGQIITGINERKLQQIEIGQRSQAYLTNWPRQVGDSRQLSQGNKRVDNTAAAHGRICPSAPKI